jgi:hypothetical protein
VQRSRINMGTAQILLRSGNLTRAQWDLLQTLVNALIAQNPALQVTVDKSQSAYQETPP